MSHQMQLIPELQQLIDDFVSVRERFGDMAQTLVSQQRELQNKQKELENATREITTLKRELTENGAIVESYNQLKIDYDRLHIASENHREEIFTENKKRVIDLEKELTAAKLKSLQQAESHEKKVTQIVVEYEAKLQDADEKIRQLNRFKNVTPRESESMENAENSSSGLNNKAAVARGGKSYLRKWPKLAVDIGPRTLASRGRGRGRGIASKRKLFQSNNEKLIDVE